MDFVNKKVFAIDDPPILGKRQKVRRRLQALHEDKVEEEEDEEEEDDDEL